MKKLLVTLFVTLALASAALAGAASTGSSSNARQCEYGCGPALN